MNVFVCLLNKSLQGTAWFANIIGCDLEQQNTELMSQPPSPAPQPSSAGAGYFVDQKKGEVNELKALLKNINVERDVQKKRDVIKKVIAYMTLGIDVSRLFTDMVMVRTLSSSLVYCCLYSPFF